MLAKELKEAEGVDIDKTPSESNQELEYPTEFTEEERRILKSYGSCSSHVFCDFYEPLYGEDDDGSTIFARKPFAYSFKPGQD